ncbi:LysR substrate-binding domain-containing protein [Streptomyces sp. NPDC090022]|uniref:LysR substrate-binding domain-containing protein n=1 Tax=Streptomyces sp. NPDC090022 TaxID=3365920 RepID=UPI003815BF6C
MTPTEAGAAVLTYARAALAAVEGIRRTADEFRGLLRGRVAIGLLPGAAGTAVAGFDVVALPGDFHDAHPRVEMALTEDTSERMLAALRRGELDIALIGLTGAEPEGVTVQVVLDEPLVAVVHADDPLVTTATAGTASATATATAGTVGPADLRGRPVTCLPRGTGVRAVLERACAAEGFAPRVDFEAAAPAVLVRLAERGLGVAVVPAGAGGEPGAGGGVRELRITGPGLSGRVAPAWRTDGPAGPAARTLLAALRAGLPAVAGVGAGAAGAPGRP